MVVVTFMTVGTCGVYWTPTLLPASCQGSTAGVTSGLVQICGALAGTTTTLEQVIGAEVALPLPADSQYSAYCSAVSAAFNALCFSRRLPAIFSSNPKL